MFDPKMGAYMFQSALVRTGGFTLAGGSYEQRPEFQSALVRTGGFTANGGGLLRVMTFQSALVRTGGFTRRAQYKYHGPFCFNPPWCGQVGSPGNEAHGPALQVSIRLGADRWVHLSIVSVILAASCFNPPWCGQVGSPLPAGSGGRSTVVSIRLGADRWVHLSRWPRWLIRRFNPPWCGQVGSPYPVEPPDCQHEFTRSSEAESIFEALYRHRLHSEAIFPFLISVLSVF